MSGYRCLADALVRLKRTLQRSRQSAVRSIRMPLTPPLTLLSLALAAGTAALTLISVSDEIAMGRDAQKQVRSQVPVVNDQAVVTYVARIGRALVARAGGPKYPYSFSVANYREINAFALPGGPVWMHRGAISAARNEAQLAGVLAHEIA